MSLLLLRWLHTNKQTRLFLLQHWAQNLNCDVKPPNPHYAPFPFFSVSFSGMDEPESMIDMGKRPSRQRRHLPTSITSAAKTRSDKERRNITLINMFNEKKDDNSSKSTSYEPATTATKHRKPHQQQQQQIHKQKARQFVTKSKTTAVSTTKLTLYTLGSLWIAFVIYRIYYSMQTEDMSYLSIVHFISKKVTDLMHEPTI